MGERTGPHPVECDAAWAVGRAAARQEVGVSGAGGAQRGDLLGLRLQHRLELAGRLVQELRRPLRSAATLLQAACSGRLLPQTCASAVSIITGLSYYHGTQDRFSPAVQRSGWHKAMLVCVRDMATPGRLVDTAFGDRRFNTHLNRAQQSVVTPKALLALGTKQRAL